VYGPVALNERDYSVNEIIAPKIRKLPEVGAAAEMLRLVCIAPRALEGTFLRDLDR
jgi:hypothetical protein